jgi:hypothetical protein
MVMSVHPIQDKITANKSFENVATFRFMGTIETNRN